MEERYWIMLVESVYDLLFPLFFIGKVVYQ